MSKTTYLPYAELSGFRWFSLYYVEFGFRVQRDEEVTKKKVVLSRAVFRKERAEERFYNWLDFISATGRI